MLNDNDSSWTAVRMQEAVDSIAATWTSPSVVYKPKIFKDGNKWCALYGENMLAGVVAFGDSPDDAVTKFNSEWYKKLEVQ